MNRKQIEVLKWLDELELYAKEQNLSTRILDNIADCKRQIAVENTNWNHVNYVVEDLLVSIEHRSVPSLTQTDKQESEISVQAIKERVIKIAERCHTENESSAANMGEEKNAILKKLYSEMQEISYTKAHLEELKNEDLYLDFFHKTKKEYEKNVVQMLCEMISNVGNNYNYMLDHMRSMFQSLKGYKSGVGNEKFYYEYEERKDGIAKKMQNEAETAEVGGSEIILFGQKTKDAVKKIIKKVNRKRKLLLWMPFIILLLCFSYKAVASQVQSREVIANTEAEENKENSEVKDFLTDTGKQIGKKAVESVSLNTLGSFLSAIATFAVSLIISLGVFLLFILLLIIVLYAVYIKILTLWCNHQICKKCGEYLKTELLQFEHNNTMMAKLDEAMKNFIEEYEQQYLSVLNHIFSETKFDSSNTDARAVNQFTVIKDKWNILKYE